MLEKVTKWNNTPRMMWVWDDDESFKFKKYVIYIVEDSDNTPFPVITYNSLIGTEIYKYCAEYTENDSSATNKEFSRWLRERSNREWRYRTGNNVYNNYSYNLDKEDEPIDPQILVREGDEPWHILLTKSECI